MDYSKIWTPDNILAAVAIGFSGMAAFRWYQASILKLPDPPVLKNEPPNQISGVQPISMGTEAQNTRALNTSTTELLGTLRQSGKLNTKAAFWSMLTAVALSLQLGWKLVESLA